MANVLRFNKPKASSTVPLRTAPDKEEHKEKENGYNPIPIQQSLFLGYNVPGLINAPIIHSNGNGISIPEFPLFEQRPKLIEGAQKLPRGWGPKAATNSIKNIGNLYRALYSALFLNGYMPDESVFSLPSEDDTRFFRPDILLDTLLGTYSVEIKARHNGNSKHPCSKRQLESYAFDFLYKLLENKEIEPYTGYAFFMYGEHDPMKLWRLESREAMIKLANSTKELVMVPLNLAFLIFSMSRTEGKGLDSSDQYWIVNGHLLHKLHEGALDVFDIIDYQIERTKRTDNFQIDEKKVKRLANNPNLCLDDLVVSHQSSEMKQLTYEDIPLAPFKITAYSLRKPEKWNSSFARHHQKILSNLGVSDLYQEYRNDKKKNLVPF